MKMALIIIDVQEEYVGSRRGSESFNNIMAHINYSSFLFREAKLPVVVVRDISEGEGESMQNVKDLAVSDTDIQLTKTFNNSFWQTDLENILKNLEVDFLVLCGNAAEYCVGATYNGATERGFKATLLQNGIFAEKEENLLMHFYSRPLISCTAIEGLIG